MKIGSLLAIAAAMNLSGADLIYPIRTPRRIAKHYSPFLHPTKGWRGVKKTHRAKFKRRGKKS